jgi:hypothetical protein
MSQHHIVVKGLHFVQEDSPDERLDKQSLAGLNEFDNRWKSVGLEQLPGGVRKS